MECEIYKEDKEGKSIIIEPLVYTTSINYDLVSHILGYEMIEDEEVLDKDYMNETQAIDEAKDDLKIAIKKCSDCNEISMKSDEIFETLRKKIGKFSEIEKLSKDDSIFVYETLKNPQHLKDSNNVGLLYYPCNYYFINRIPHQLSTFEALKKLIKEVESKSFKNPVLHKLLCNALVSDDVSIDVDYGYESEIEEVIDKYLPISLSNVQKRAIKNAWASEISYIQGPPGTGKSHTITAIILSAVYLNKKF